MAALESSHSARMAGVGQGENETDPWDVVAELRNLSSLTADIAGALSQSLSLRRGLYACADALVHGLDAAFARIWTLDDKQEILELQASAGMYTHLDGAHSRIPVGQFKIGLIARERKPHLTNAVIGDPRISDREWALRERMVAFAGYPLVIGDRVIGVMAVFSRQPFPPATLHALGAVADSIAYGIDHWQTIEALRVSEERFELAIRGTAEGIWDWNIVSNEIYLAPRVMELLGFHSREVVSHYVLWKSRVHPDDQPRVIDALQLHLLRGEPFQEDYRLKLKSGEYGWFQSRGQAVWGENGRAIRMVGSIRDITAQRLSEARLAAVHKVTQILAETSELTESLPRILMLVCEQLNWAVGEFWKHEPKQGVLRLEAFSHLPTVSVPNFEAESLDRTFRCGVGLPGRTCSSRRPEWIEDVTLDKNFPRAESAARDNLHSAVAFPILVGGEVYGVMEFFNHCILQPNTELIDALGDIGHLCSRCIDLQQEQQRIREHRQELSMAHRIQRHMFPRDMPLLEGYEIAGASMAAAEAGGDYFDFIPLQGGHLLFPVGDVSGHGLGPALLMAGARAYIRVLGLMDITIDRIVNLVNKRLCEDTDEAFMTLLLGVLNPKQRTLFYYNAGHCPGMIIDAAGEMRATLSATDLPLGIDPLHVYQNSGATQLVPGDLVLLHTDGVFEAFSPGGEAFGMARVLKTVRAVRKLPASEIIANLFQTVREFAQDPLQDDMTAVIIKVAEAA